MKLGTGGWTRLPKKIAKNDRGGVGRLSVSKIEKYLRENSDPNNFILQEKITRYLDLRRIYVNLGDSIKVDGTTISVTSGGQNYVKVNPAITEKEKINYQLINLEKEIALSVKPGEIIPSQTLPNGPHVNSKGGLV